jgi:TPR repeat protein
VSRIWDDRLAEVWAAPGKAGSGIVVGDEGILTARHVVAGALPNGEVLARVIKPGATTAGWTPVKVLAEDQDWDLAVLAVDREGANAADSRSTWRQPLSPSPVAARIGTSAEPGCETVGFPQSEIQSRPVNGGASVVRQTEQVQGTLLPAGQGKPPTAPDRVLPRRWLPLDVQTATPTVVSGWAGMSGAGVTLPNGRLVGIVVDVEVDHQQRRLYVVPLADVIESSALIADALASLTEGRLVIESPMASAYRDVLKQDCLGSDGLPLRVADADLSAFGVKPAGIEGEPAYLDYIPRDSDPALQSALAGAPTDHRIALVVGGSAGGKSRSAAEMTRHLFGQYRLLCPRQGSLSALAELEGFDFRGSVVWLDDVERYDERTFRDAIDSLLDRGAVVVATIRRTELEARMPRKEIRNQLGDTLTNSTFVVEINWPVKWSPNELALVREHVSNPSLLRWTATGNSPSSWVVAGPALVGKLRSAAADDERPSRNALMRAVLDWYRTGISRPIPKATASELTSVYLAEQTEAHDLADSFEWAFEPVMGASRLTAQSLLTELPDCAGIVVHDYVQDSDSRSLRPDIPAQVLAAALDYATSDDQRAAVGISGALQGNLDVAARAWIPLAENGDTEVMANLLLVLKDSDPDEARRWGEAAAVAGNAVAMFNLGFLLADTAPDESRSWYEQAAEAGHTEAMVNLAVMLQDIDPDTARRWYDRAVDAGSVHAMNNLAILLYITEPEEARQLWERAAEAGSTEAMTSLGRVLVDTEPDRARHLWEEAAERDFVPAMYNLGLLLDQTEPQEATRWLRQAAAAGSPEARTRLGVLAVATAPAETRALWESAASDGDASAMLNLWFLLKESEPDQARSWLEAAAMAESTDAMYIFGYLLTDTEPDESRTWLEKAANAGSTDAMIGLGILLGTSEPEQARNWFERAAERGRVEAMVGLGGLLRTSDALAARTWWEMAAERGNTIAMNNLAVLLRESESATSRMWEERLRQAGGLV